MSMYEIDSAYVRRCQKRLQEWGAPLSGWYCDYIYDVADEEEDPDYIDLFTCELCDCSQVRFVHVMRHDEYFETVSVGCICAGIMEGDILAAREREWLMKNRAELSSPSMAEELVRQLSADLSGQKGVYQQQGRQSLQRICGWQDRLELQGQTPRQFCLGRLRRF